MACYWPVSLHRPGGHLPLKVPCGGCIGCRLERSRQWAVRCVHEASMHEENCFLTLTYDEEHLPPGGSLDRQAFPLFMKRLRKAIAPKKVRYFHAGEYGERFGRPHYHAVLFGHDFADKVPWTRRGDHEVWRSPALESLWPLGQSELGTVTFESAAYVARYMVKKSGRQVRDELLALDGDTGECWPIEEEYQTMSRRPGIGRPWFDRFGRECYPDGVLVREHLSKPPRYYDSCFEVLDPTELERVKQCRALKVRPGEGSRERLAVREKVTKANVLSRRLG